MQRLRSDTAAFLLISVILVGTGVHARPGYLLTAPKVLLPGPEELCVSFHDIDFDIELSVQLQPAEKSLDRSTYMAPIVNTFDRGNGRCFTLNVPNNITGGKALLAVWGGSFLSAQEHQYAINATTKLVGIGVVGLMTFIQTDKPIYKPGQTVKFRILTLKSDLKPLLETIEQVWVEDPNGVRISQWDTVETLKGLASLELPMSPEPVLGEWSIHTTIQGKEDIQYFTVDEYVLPKYELIITPPPYVSVETEMIIGKVCAKYTYGEPVRGTLELNISAPSQSSHRRRPTLNLTESDFNGCHTFRANASELRLNDNRYSIWRLKLIIEAAVTEAATGVTLYEIDNSVEVTREALKVDISKHTPPYFKPGLPYTGKGVVTKPDGSPASDEPILVEMHNYQHHIRFSENCTTDAKGEFEFSLPAVDASIPSYSVEAIAVNYRRDYNPRLYSIYTPSTYTSVRQWYSPSGSFLQLEPPNVTLPCHGNAQVKVRYTTEANTISRFHYQAMARGNIVASGHKRHHFQHHGVETQEEPQVLPVQTDSPEPVSTVGRRLRSRPGPRRHPRPRPPTSTPPTDNTVQLPPHVAEFTWDIPIIPKMSPKLHLLVYYVREDGETVADSLNLDVSKCFDNQVEMQFDAQEKYPGESTTLELRADPGSLCAYGVVDKSVTLLGGNNQMTLGEVFAKLTAYELDSDSGPYQRDTYCERWVLEQRRAENAGPRPPRPGGHRDPRSSYWPGSYYSEYADSMTAFKNQHVVVLSDRVLQTRPCIERRYDLYRLDSVSEPRGGGMPGLPGMPNVEFASVDEERAYQPGSNPVNSDSGVAKPVVELRNYFPETWLWDLEEIGERGVAEVQTALPHTITQWIGSTFCTNEDTGLGTSQATAIKAFQPFFVSFTLPYSVVRGEKIVFPITAFNYLSECLVIELAIKRGEHFSFVGARKTKLCVCGGESKSHRFTIVPSQIGDVNITVKAESKENDGVCGNGISMSSQIGVRDAVTRTLLVEPEGIEEEYTHSAFVCPEDGQTHSETLTLYLPPNLVPDSARAKVTAIGDVMGPALSGLDKLVKLPTGCGEQNMLNFAPNIFVMQYLAQTNQRGGNIENKAVEYMKTGYQRELTYKREDNSYSAFGNSDPQGSTWLTAFVVKCFAQARPFIFIDPSNLHQSMNWFRSNQLENGCFSQVGRVIHKDMKGGLGDGGSPATLTAFVLISMLEAGVAKNDSAVREGFRCLNIPTSDTYTTTLKAYAYTLWDKNSPERQEAMVRLDDMATREDGLVYWKKSQQPTPTPREDGLVLGHSHRIPSADIEMTSYALMAYMTGEGRDAVSSSLPIVQWLSKQRNADGGFSSTQDTVVALQALAQYAAFAYGENMDLRITVDRTNAEGTEQVAAFDIDASNSLVLQNEDLQVPNTPEESHMPTTLNIRASGTGCAFVQASVKYNIFNATFEEPAFKITARVGRATRADTNCEHRSINICTKYTGSDGASNMAVVATKMVSGWIPDKMSLRELQKDGGIDLKRFEVDKNMVHFYFDELTADYTCFSFIVEQHVEVQDPKPGFVQVYDYYETEKSAMSPYKISLTCGTKEELPHITREEWLEMQERDPAEIGQVRMPDEFPGLFPEILPGEVFNEDVVDFARPVPQCPVCLSQAPEDVLDIFCDASHAYKANVKRNAHSGRFSKLKITRDIRAGVRSPTQVAVRLPEGCSCDTVMNGVANSVVVVLTNEEVRPAQQGENIGTLSLTSDTTVVPLTSGPENLERELKRHQC